MTIDRVEKIWRLRRFTLRNRAHFQNRKNFLRNEQHARLKPETLPLESFPNPLHVLTTPKVPKNKLNKQKQSKPAPSPKQTPLVKPSTLKL
ncbi:hypothetical protein AKJ39_04395 [candidate division MSBL1 archaeon SCGC-AAA259J03]|uniref:Uncharacterized protein n=1 Tax=candidate division MSBL1 archaeon SCGC-AAA259J03 TaxID=1698269 RepID=A0A656YUX5_9EURY|nr:hypothetical protein AKJ39_04395 [candidate division MSBL1 archaeon SCGC-AAA259J03]